jgi:molybdopterin biosynthesis enzyme
MISLDDARAFVLASSVARPSETIALEDARGRYLAQALHASEDLIPFARSAMDGFAVLSSDTGRGATLPVGERVFAEAGDVVHRSGTATPISTGAPLPRGADAVIPIEDTSVESAGVRLSGAVAPGDHVFPPGEDALRGDVLARAGTRFSVS